MKPAVVVAAFALFAIATGDMSLGTAVTGKGSNPVNPAHTRIYDPNTKDPSYKRNWASVLNSPASSADVRLSRKEMAEIARTVQDAKDAVQGILWIANILMGQLYEIFIN